MNKNKICFIYCVNDERLFEESLRYIHSLHIPDGFELDVIDVREAESMASGYNAAMKNSDAKYKVYLHQDTLIINKNFLFDILHLFQNNQKLGLIGLTGARKLASNGVWWESKSNVGKVYESHTGRMSLLAFEEVQNDYEQVEGIDGFIMITQEDVEWREDLFQGWHLYDISQVFEFKRAGFEVGVPKQESPWCIHDCGKVNFRNGYEENRLILLKEYALDFQPLVSVMIPTYNRPYYFELALKSVLMQTYKNIEIIICDDSTNNETKKLIQPYLKKFNQIRYYKNPKNLGQFQNDLLCMEYAKGEFVNFLMDDDLFHPQKIEKMMDYFQGDLNNEIMLVASHRQLIDNEGNFLEDNKVTLKIFEKDVVVDGIEFGELLLTVIRNYIGEPTTVLFRKAALEEPFGMFMGREYGCNVDMASWFNLLSKGKMAYLSESLSYFRMHAGQQQQSGKMVIFGMCDFIHQVLYAQERGFFKNPMKYVQVIQNCLKRTEQSVKYISRNFSDSQYTEMIFKYKKLLEEKLSKVYADLPLVSILIPAYNRPHYLELALQSALNQTYLNTEIIICDDSTNDEVEKMVQPYLVKSRNLQYYRNGKQLVAGNVYKLMDLAKGEFVAFLNDDDLFYDRKVQKMVDVLYVDPSITLVTSYRKMIDENGELIKDSDINRPLFDKDILMDGKVLGTNLLMATFNGIGEPSTAMFRKSSLTEKFGLLNGLQYSSINDLASWVLLMSKGNVYYFVEPLSFTRIHASQNQLKPKYISLGIKEWIQIIMDSRKFGFLNTEDDFKTAIRNYLILADSCTKRTISLNGERFLEEIGAEQFIEEAKNILQNHVDQFECSYCNHRFNEFKPYPDKFDFPDHLFEMDNKYSYFCPNCESMDRERLYKLFIETETDLFCTKKDVLHIAPEKNFRNLLQNNKQLNYNCGDLYPQDTLTKRIDITDIQYADNTFDVILCSHVLEHVPNDRLAMKEFYRVLKPGGWGILQVPICISIDETYEDFSITTPEGRKKAFGQDDHVRIYEKSDYIRRLVETGFDVELYNFAEKCGENEARKYGISKTDNLYVVHKK